MNIISNRCLGGFIYTEVLKEPFGNPFIWTRLECQYLLYLINNYENINFKNYTIVKQTNELSKFNTVIDGKIVCQNNHMWFSAKDNIPRKEKNNVYYNKIWEYIANNYDKRLDRMIKSNEKPIIVLDDVFKGYDKIIKACKLKKYRLLIFTNTLKAIKTKDLYIINYKIKNLTTNKQFAIQYKKEILNWLKL